MTDLAEIYEDALKELDDAKKVLEKAKEEQEGKEYEVFKLGSKLLFDKHPDLHSFDWTQYTPYFNDGDECIFSVNCYDPGVNGLPGYELYGLNDEEIIDLKDGEWGDYEETYYATKGITQVSGKSINEMTSDVSDFLKNFSTEFYKNKFGDHSKVIVTLKGYEIEDYDHD